MADAYCPKEPPYQIWTQYQLREGSYKVKCKSDLLTHCSHKTGKGQTIIFYWGGGGVFPFLRLADNFFLKSNAFQTIFFITFCNENNFL